MTRPSVLWTVLIVVGALWLLVSGLVLWLLFEAA